MTIETSLNSEGYQSEIEIDKGVLTKLGFFLGQDEAEAYKELKHEVWQVLDELDSEEKLEKDSDLEEEITIAVEDKRDASTYKSITFNLILKIDEYGDITGNIQES